MKCIFCTYLLVQVHQLLPFGHQVLETHVVLHAPVVLAVLRYQSRQAPLYHPLHLAVLVDPYLLWFQVNPKTLLLLRNVVFDIL